MHGRIWLNTKSEPLKPKVWKFVLKWYLTNSISFCKIEQNDGLRCILFYFWMHLKFESVMQAFIARSDSEKAVWLDQNCGSSYLLQVWTHMLSVLVSPSPAKP